MAGVHAWPWATLPMRAVGELELPELDLPGSNPLERLPAPLPWLNLFDLCLDPWFVRNVKLATLNRSMLTDRRQIILENCNRNALSRNYKA